MEENNKKLTSYCFIAALTENNYDLFKGVYTPLIKRALSYYSMKINSFGHDSDLQSTIYEIYGISVPIVVVRQVLRRIENSFSRKEKEKYAVTIFESGKSFEFKSFDFTDLEYEYKSSERNINLLEDQFIQYLKNNSIDISNVPKLSEFIEKFKNTLSSFFKSTPSIDKNEIDKSFIHHVTFLQHIETNNDKLFKIAELIYLGTVVASFLESGIELEAKFSSEEEYYLDTQIILKALSLQNENESTPAIELLDIIKSSGGKLKVLDITIDELLYILKSAIDNYSSKHPITLINEACIRNGFDRAWLINLRSNLENILTSKFDITKDTIPASLKEKFLKSTDIEDLKEIRVKQDNAKHDVQAYLFIRHKRNGFISIIQKCKYWFVSANKNLFQFNISKLANGHVSEIVLPDVLTSVLWLKNPQKYNKIVKKIGLNEIIAQTFREETPNRDVLNNFSENLKKYSNISDEQYNILISSIANESAKNIHKLNELASEENKDEFVYKIHQLIDRERDKKQQDLREIKRNREFEADLFDEKMNLEEELKDEKSKGKKVKINY